MIMGSQKDFTEERPNKLCTRCGENFHDEQGDMTADEFAACGAGIVDGPDGWNLNPSFRGDTGYCDYCTHKMDKGE